MPPEIARRDNGERHSEAFMPPLRKPRSEATSPTHRDIPRPSNDVVFETPETDVPRTECRAIKPTLVRHVPEMSPEVFSSLLPRLTRPEYYSNPSVEAMSKMSETKLWRVDNFEIGRYGFGSIRWPGLTDVRGLDLDELVVIDRASMIVHVDKEQWKIGDGLNKEAVISLDVKSNKNLDAVRTRLQTISESFGGTFCDYNGEKWIFRLPHFDGLPRGSGRS